MASQLLSTASLHVTVEFFTYSTIVLYTLKGSYRWVLIYATRVIIVYQKETGYVEYISQGKADGHVWHRRKPRLCLSIKGKPMIMPILWEETDGQVHITGGNQ